MKPFPSNNLLTYQAPLTTTTTTDYLAYHAPPATTIATGHPDLTDINYYQLSIL